MKEEFDFLKIVYERLHRNFAEEIGLEGTIPYYEVYRFLGLQFSMKKEDSKKLLKAMLKRYKTLSLRNHGIEITMPNKTF